MASVFYKELGALLRDARKSASLTQQDIADRLRVSRTTVASWEIGRRVIYADDLMKYCDALNLDINDVIAKVRKYVYK